MAVDNSWCLCCDDPLHCFALADACHELPRLSASAAHVIASIEMLISFSVCGIGIMFFYGLLTRPLHAAGVDEKEIAFGRSVGRRRFVALGIGAAFALALGSTLRRLFRMGTFSYDGRQYRGPKVQKITPIRPDDEFYQVSKTSLILISHGIRGAWTLLAKLKTRMFILSPTLPRCRPFSRKRRCFVFPTG